ncbi:hypothetical protein [Uliginosibacterium sediminicola]|uniref:Uncharacterized protein n=1 Tax=Uliginosibacterium sediminicola TaxID=2024550 RepID=A0ABU9YW30_9RHOO
MSIDADPRAAKNFYREVRAFSERTRPWETAVFYSVMPDERFDLSRVSARVYGRRDEFLAVMAAAGLSSFDQPLEQTTLVLPNEQQLARIKRETGFESIARLRADGAPTWA